jgi:hypothetical protein
MHRRVFAATCCCFGAFALYTISFLNMKIAAGRFMRESTVTLCRIVNSGIDCVKHPAMDAIVSMICMRLTSPGLQPHTGTESAIQVSGLNIYILLCVFLYYLQTFIVFTTLFSVVEVSLKFD